MKFSRTEKDCWNLYKNKWSTHYFAGKSSLLFFAAVYRQAFRPTTSNEIFRSETSPLFDSFVQSVWYPLRFLFRACLGRNGRPQRAGSSVRQWQHISECSPVACNVGRNCTIRKLFSSIRGGKTRGLPCSVRNGTTYIRTHQEHLINPCKIRCRKTSKPNREYLRLIAPVSGIAVKVCFSNSIGRKSSREWQNPRPDVLGWPAGLLGKNSSFHCYTMFTRKPHIRCTRGRS